MYIGMNHIAELCKGMEHQLIRANSRYGLTGWLMLKDAPIPYNKHLLYITDSTVDLSACPLIEGMHLLVLMNDTDQMGQLESTIPIICSALLVRPDAPSDFILQIQKYFEYTVATGLFAQSLLEIMSYEGGIQGMVNHALKILENPIFVFDSTFYLIAANWQEAEKHPSAQKVIQNKGLSTEEFRLLERANLHNKVLKSDRPLKIHHAEVGCDQMVVAIDTERDRGHIVVSAVNRPFNTMDENSLWILKQFVNQQLKKEEFTRNSKGFHYENFLQDLLDEKIAINHNLLYNRMQYVGVAFSGSMYCAVVELARTPTIPNPYRVRNLFESNFSNIKTLIYSGQIVILFSVPASQLDCRELTDKINELCRRHQLYVGLSNIFDDILSLPAYYRQALRSIELGVEENAEPRVYTYQEYFLSHMKHIFLQKESTETFCHPRMKILFDHDKKKHSELAYTLYMYLLYERNIGAASEAMHMHRSSLSYRFKKIFSLIGDDFEDPAERQYLLMSYELNRSTNK